MDLAGEELEGDLDRLARLDIAGINLGNLDADERVGRVDERHHRRKRQRRNARTLAQREVGHVAVGRRAHPRLFEVPPRRLELCLEGFDVGAVLLDVEGTSSLLLLQRRELLEAQLGKAELGLERVHLGFERHGIDAEEHVAAFDRCVGCDRNIDDFP